MNYVDPSGLKIDDPNNIIPKQVRETELYKCLDAKDEEIVFYSTPNLPAAGRTVMLNSGPQIIGINLDNQRDPSDNVDTFMHELNHANQNLLLGGPKGKRSAGFRNSLTQA